MYYRLEDRLKDLKISDLLKIYNSNKNYISSLMLVYLMLELK